MQSELEHEGHGNFWSREPARRVLSKDILGHPPGRSTHYAGMLPVEGNRIPGNLD